MNETPISHRELKELHEVDPWHAASGIFLWWLLILGCIQASIVSNSLFLQLLLFILIGCLQNGLISWIHEASHWNLHRNKRINDLIADFVLCGPTGVSVDQYRWHHGNHHRYLGDPQKEIELAAWTCIRGWKLFFEVAKYLLGFYALNIILRRKRFSGPDSNFPPPPAKSVTAWCGFILGNLALLLMCSLQGKWYLYFLMWVAPLFTIALLISSFRTLVEHQNGSEICKTKLVKMSPVTRIFQCSQLERFLIAPVGFYYHYEHHLYPCIPYYKLADARLMLEKNGHFKTGEHIRTKGYFSTLWQLATLTPPKNLK